MQIPVSRRFVTDLTDTETVDQVFIANEKQLRTNRNGNLYLQVRLSDRTGSVTAMLWNAHQKQFDSFENGDYITRARHCSAVQRQHAGAGKKNRTLPRH